MGGDAILVTFELRALNKDGLPCSHLDSGIFGQDWQRGDDKEIGMVFKLWLVWRGRSERGVQLWLSCCTFRPSPAVQSWVWGSRSRVE